MNLGLLWYGEFHKREDFASIGRWLEGPEKYFLQSFVDSGDLIRPGLRAYTKEILLQALEIVKEHIPNAELRRRGLRTVRSMFIVIKDRNMFLWIHERKHQYLVDVRNVHTRYWCFC